MSSLLSRKLQKAQDCFRANDLASAEHLCGEILQKAPRHPAALHLLGVVRLLCGKPMEAVSLIERALGSNPVDAVMMGNLGAACLAAADLERAELVLRQTLKQDPSNALTHMRLGTAWARQGKYEDAISMLRRAVELAPAEPDIHRNLGNALAGHGEPALALESYQRVIVLQPANVDAHFDIGVLLQEQERFNEARDAYVRALAVDPRHAGALINLGWMYRQTGQFGQAMDCYQALLAFEPNNVDAHHNLGIVFRCQGLLEEASACFEKALAIAPSFTDALNSLGIVRFDQGRVAESKNFHQKALAIDPGNADAQFNVGLRSLIAGDWERGWPGYQFRPPRLLAELEKTVESDLKIPERPCSLLLQGEQGIGDELFFLRFAPALKAFGFSLHCRCDRKIQSLFERTGLFVSVIISGDPTPTVDQTLLVGDLPLFLSRYDLKTRMPTGNNEAHSVLGTTSQTAHRHPPFESLPLAIKALDTKAAPIRERLNQLGPPPYIGLTWRAGTPMTTQHARRHQSLCKEVPLQELIPALKNLPGTLLALQRHPEAGEIDELSAALGRKVHDFSDVNDDLEEMLAVLALLDEYVGVSNTNLHLRAGLGRSARILIPHPPEWRWMAEGKASPWFPGVIVYRQAVNGSWSDAMASLATDLKDVFG